MAAHQCRILDDQQLNHVVTALPGPKLTTGLGVCPETNDKAMMC
jgi:hypothetical protein